MKLAISLLLTVSIACTAPAAHAIQPAFVARDVSSKLTFLFDGTWSYTVNDDATRVATLFGRVKGVTHISIESKFRDLVEATKASHHLNFDRDFEHHVTSQKLGAVRQFILQQVIDARPVENAYLLVNFNESAQTLEIVDQTVPRILPKVTRTPAEAQRIVLQALCSDLGLQPGPADESGIRPCPLPESVTIATKEKAMEPQLLSLFGKVYAVYHFDAEVKQKLAEITTVVALREYDISADSGRIDDAVIRKIDRIHHSVHGRGRVFDPSPLMVKGRSAINPENVRDDDRAYVWKALPDLYAPVNGKFTLTGTYAAIVDIEDPKVSPIVPTSIKGGVPRFCFSRTNTNAFAGVMAYYHVAGLQRHTAALGFAERRQKPLRIDILVGSETDHLPAVTQLAEFVDGSSSSVGDGYMVFGRFQPTDSLVSDAEDGEIIAHEYGHALLLYDAHGRFGTEMAGALITKEPKIISEGFADFWAMSTFAAAARRSRHDPRCFAAWGGGSACFRQIGKLHTTDEINPGMDAHEAGELWSGVLADISEKIFRNRRTAERIILQGHLNAMNRGWVPTMSAAAQGILKADGDEHRGRHRAALCSVFAEHHIRVSCCSPYGCLLVPPI